MLLYRLGVKEFQVIAELDVPLQDLLGPFMLFLQERSGHQLEALVVKSCLLLGTSASRTQPLSGFLKAVPDNSSEPARPKRVLMKYRYLLRNRRAIRNAAPNSNGSNTLNL